jgi:hypothetical protein
MTRIRTLAVVSVLVCGCGGDTPQTSAQPVAQPNEPKAEESHALLDAARARLGKLGYQPAASVVPEQRTAKEVIRDFDAQQDLLLPPASFPVQHALFAGLGIPAGQTPADLREQSVAAMVRGVSAYYDPVHKAFVLLPTLTRQMAEALAGGAAPLITHELVHACQDAREGGLVGWFDATNRTLDEANARRIVVEGEAELVAVLALAGEPGVQMLEGDEAENTLESVLAGEFTARVYSAGRRLMRERYAAGRLEAVRALWQLPPASSEQAMHARKLGSDVPTAVVVPAIEGLREAHATTLGEFVVLNVLRLLKVDRLDARIAAAGWDGDRCVVFARGDAEAEAVVWRTVWDRDADAEDFAARIASAQRGVVRRDGRVVDWVHAADADLVARIVAVCDADRPQPKADAADAESTAAVEAALTAAQPRARAEHGFWRHEAYGLAVPIPEGWEVRDFNGTEMLFEKPIAGFAANVNVLSMPAGPLVDLEAIVRGTRAQLERLKLDLGQFEIVERDGVEVVLGHYSGRMPGQPPLHFLMLGLLRSGQQIYVTITTSVPAWQADAASYRAIRDGIRIEAEKADEKGSGK